MVSTDRPPLAVILIIVVAALAGGADSASWTGACMLNGCRLSPNVKYAVTLDCDHSGIKYSWIKYDAGTRPSSIEEIRMVNFDGEVKIQEDFLTGLKNLRAFHLSNISNLCIGKTDWRKTLETENMTITIDNINRLELERDAFSGLQSPGPKIDISGVTNCSIVDSAFAADSVIKSVSFRNVRSLTIEDGAIQSEIGQVHITDSALLDSCGSNTFSGHVGNFILNRVTIVPALRAGCLQADGGWGSLTVLSSRLGDIEPLGISGTFDHFQIRNSSVGRVGQSGLNFSATSFTIHSTKVRELSSHALDVRFNHSALLKMSSFLLVRANAFIGLAANPRNTATLSLQQVVVQEAEHGSMAFDDYGRLSQLDVVLHRVCSCYPDHQALRLMTGDKMFSNATHDQRGRAQQFVAQVRCTVGRRTPTLAEFLCLECADRGEAASLCRSIEARGSGWKSWKLAPVIGLPLLFVGVVALLIVRKVRQRNTSPTNDISPSLALPQVPKRVSPEPRFGEALKARPRQCQNAGGGVTSQHDQLDCSGHREQQHDLDSEPVYCEINDLRFVPMSHLPRGPAGQPLYDDCGPAGQPCY
ncbi:uncharacterized protein LOC122367577 [Amphibalanus amphitrite]|uniref:uncharacterized protein LOC122367577 n=1 Tax=Amphibalanus amphitrite TaxID=1232801 RepID=UPI001C92161F|nr:uncharacterized protein LOC122367577 [Amphibalanus amphitrite]